MENTKKRMVLNIAGNRITLIMDENEKYVEKLASVVSQKVNTFTASGNGITKTDAALVYALTLLDENIKLKLELEEAKKSKNEN